MTTYPPSPPTDDRATASQGRGETDPIEILHVEPSSRVAELLAAFADQAPDRFVVRSVDRVTAAMESVEDADCVVTEQRLPDGTGVELLGHVRRAGSDVPAVFHTTCRGTDVEAAAIAAGADTYLRKTSERGQYDAILDRVRSLVGDDRPDRTVAPATADAPETHED